MFLYLVMARPIGHMAEMKATVELIKKIYGAQCQGHNALGMIYATKSPIPEREREKLGVVPWE